MTISKERLAELIEQDEALCLLREPGSFVQDTINALRELQQLRGAGVVLADIVAERKRQRDVEGWTLAHDDMHDEGELAEAAACYAWNQTQDADGVPPQWPWHEEWWKPKGRRRNLIRAAALLVAEIERLDRLAASQPDSGEQ